MVTLVTIPYETTTNEKIIHIVYGTGLNFVIIIMMKLVGLLFGV